MSTNEITEYYIKSLVMKKSKKKKKKTFEMLMPNFDYKEYIPFSSIMIDVKNNNKRDNVKNAVEDKIENAKAIINIEDTSSYMAYQC